MYRGICSGVILLGIISFKSFRQHFPFTSTLYEALVGRVARRAYLSAFFLLILLTTAVRIRSYFMVRRFQRVLSGLSHTQIDKTTEAELVRLVPYLDHGATEITRDGHVERNYYVVLSNKSDSLMYRLNFSGFGYWLDRSRALKLANWFGYRYIDFSVQLLVIDGNLSRVGYVIAADYTIPAGYEDFITFRSAHGLWAQEGSTLVTPADDENPQFRVSGDEKSLRVTYTFDAPLDQTSRALDINLSCFWSFRKCRTARDIAPLLWQYKNEIQEKAFSRLGSDEPCPDRILAERVRYLPDLDVLLLDIVRVPTQGPGYGRAESGKSLIGYRLRQIILGSQGVSHDAIKFRYNPEIRESSNISFRSANAISREPQLGDRVLLFTGEQFQSCQMIRDTPSVLRAVQKAVPMPRRQEDEIMAKSRL